MPPQCSALLHIHGIDCSSFKQFTVAIDCNPTEKRMMSLSNCNIFGGFANRVCIFQFRKLIRSKYIALVGECLSFSERNINPHFS